ncbi:Transcriptional regulator MntR [Rubripirellula reticaptiva]|uniref:Transcriptional regulator MntR n=1 Tax=Rubripirellula reticaptiva TaxID=2528013 RepID=A0A5C6EAY7_9BACT|nr:Transcriptional regulator MntR [Rubripirellula reticaptiva]
MVAIVECIEAVDLASKTYQRTRSDHASEIAEDYVEAIADAIADKGVCRAMDLVAHFAVTHATVSNTVGRLQRDGLVETAPYQPISLTSQGKRLATKSRKRHETVIAFLRRIGVAESTAIVDSEGIEHHVSDETLKAMKGVLENGLPPD